VTKEGLAARVVDRQQVSRTISREEMLHLFEFGDEELLEQNEKDSTMIDCDNAGNENPDTFASTELEPLDKLMMNLLSEHNR
jgi:transcriptional regulator ATRX